VDLIIQSVDTAVGGLASAGEIGNCGVPLPSAIWSLGQTDEDELPRGRSPAPKRTTEGPGKYGEFVPHRKQPKRGWN
jgi:hypothetical protein